VRQLCQQTSILILAAIMVLISACATPASSTSTGDSVAVDSGPFENLLVIGVGEDYEGRTRFERKLSADLRKRGIQAMAYHSAIGGNKPIDRESILQLIESKGFDAVVISRAANPPASGTSIKPGSVSTKVVRKDGRPIDLFRYDYEELNEPAILKVDLSVVLTTELYASASRQKVWTMETTVSHDESVGYLIHDAADAIVRGLKRDKLIR